MDVDKKVDKKIKKVNYLSCLFSLFVFLIMVAILVATLAFAQEPQERFVTGLNNICIMVKNLLPIVVILLFVIAALVYGVGQIFGAEMKSKAQSWATNMVVGAIIGLIIWVLTKPILSLFLPEEAIPTSFCE